MDKRLTLDHLVNAEISGSDYEQKKYLSYAKKLTTCFSLKAYLNDNAKKMRVGKHFVLKWNQDRMVYPDCQNLNELFHQVRIKQGS